MRLKLRQPGVLPGFNLTLGLTITYLSLIVLIPLAALFLRAGQLNWQQFRHATFDPRALASYRLTFGTAFASAGINAVMGFIVAWVLVRYRFTGRRLFDALIDLPFALPTAVAGIALTTLYAPTGWIGSNLVKLGINAVFNPLGIIIALTFVGLPFVVRTLQPVLEDLGSDVEEASASLGATRFQTFTRVILPELWPVLLTGFALAFARALGEYGSVVFIAGNMPLKTEVTSLLIVIKLEEYDYAGATSIAVVMLVASFIMLFAINMFHWRLSHRQAGMAPD